MTLQSKHCPLPPLSFCYIKSGKILCCLSLNYGAVDRFHSELEQLESWGWLDKSRRTRRTMCRTQPVLGWFWWASQKMLCNTVCRPLCSNSPTASAQVHDPVFRRAAGFFLPASGWTWGCPTVAASGGRWRAAARTPRWHRRCCSHRAPRRYTWRKAVHPALPPHQLPQGPASGWWLS